MPQGKARAGHAGKTLCAGEAMTRGGHGARLGALETLRLRPNRLLLPGIVLALGAGATLWLASQARTAREAALAAQARQINTRHGPVEYTAWGEANGERPPVLVLHGAGGGFDQGRLLAEALGDARGDRGGNPGRRWIAVSRFGYLGSPLPPAASPDASPTAQAEALADLLDGLGISRADVLAMSGGVPPALQFAALFPDRTQRMVLLSSAPFTPFAPDEQARPIPTGAYTALLGNDTLYWLLAHTARGRLAAAFDARPDLLATAPPADRAFVEALIDTFLPASRRIAGLGNEGAAIAPGEHYQLAAIRAPVLLVHARDDRLNRFAIAEALAGGIPSSRLLTLDRGGHLLIGHHAEVRRAIAEHLASPERLAGVDALGQVHLQSETGSPPS
jgi:pimeloyl-ACP methyl ester carboxylesterase